MKKVTYDEVINRVGYFRNKSNLSLRETSIRLGYNPQFMQTIENKTIELKMRTFLDFCEIVDIEPNEFFYQGKEYSEADKELLEKFSGLSQENKSLVMNLIKNLS